jgi:hypothetical protein
VIQLFGDGSAAELSWNTLLPVFEYIPARLDAEQRNP